MKFCMECGSPAEDSQRYCRVCGTKFPDIDSPEEPGDAQEETEIVLEDMENPEDLEDQQTQWTSQAGGWDAPGSDQEDLDATGRVEENVPPADPGETVFVDQGPADPGETVYIDEDTADPGETVFADQEDVDTDDMEPETPADPEPADRAPAKKVRKPKAPWNTGKKPLLAAAIGIAAAVVLCAGAAGWMLLRPEQDAGQVVIGGQSYPVATTDTLVVEDPDQADWEGITALTQLTSLTVRGDGENTALTADDLKQLSALPSLTDLELEGVQLESVQSLEGLDQLEELAIREAGLDSEACMDLPALDQLTGLDLSDNSIQSLAFLSKFPGLTGLNLSGNPVTDYTPLTACPDLDSLWVDRCQAGVVGQLASLQELTVAGEPVEDLPAFLEEQQNIAELYDSIEGWFGQEDFETIEVAAEEYASENGTLYANGWLMDFGPDWEEVRRALPAAAMAVVVDDNGVYYGQLDQDQRSGQGTQYLPDTNSWYKGSWAHDLPNGSGSYYKPAGDGRILEFAGGYLDGYEDGPMNLVVHDGTNIQSVAYTAQQGTRTTLQQLSDSQYAFVYLEGVFWCDAQPEGHGVAMKGIAYQQEQPVAGTLTDTQTAEAADSTAASSKSSGSSKSSSSSKSSGSSSAAAPAQPSAPAQTPAPEEASTPGASAPTVPDVPSQEELQQMMQDAEAYTQQMLSGMQ